jgi:chitodextrinase
MADIAATTSSALLPESSSPVAPVDESGGLELLPNWGARTTSTSSYRKTHHLLKWQSLGVSRLFPVYLDYFPV